MKQGGTAEVSSCPPRRFLVPLHRCKGTRRRSGGTTPQSPAATAPLTGEPFPPPLQGEVAFAQQMSEGLHLIDKSQFISLQFFFATRIMVAQQFTKDGALP